MPSKEARRKSGGPKNPAGLDAVAVAAAAAPWVRRNGTPARFNPNPEAGLSVAATLRRRKVPATPSSPVAAAICHCRKKCDGGVAISLCRRAVAAPCGWPLRSSGSNQDAAWSKAGQNRYGMENR
jgi:hypothetical protein